MARVLRVAFPKSAAVRVLERTLSWFVWIVLVLWLTGLLPVVVRASSKACAGRSAARDVSLRSLIEGALTAVVVLVVGAVDLGGDRVAAAGGHRARQPVGAQDGGQRHARAAAAGRPAARAVGGRHPLTALSVLGGAIGVGIGFGLQKLAANYISGFVILAERSLRIGDMVKVDSFEGRITDISTRYTVIRALNGRESIVPNEMLITQRVENLVARRHRRCRSAPRCRWPTAPTSRPCCPSCARR